jgi:hypothetical protein
MFPFAIPFFLQQKIFRVKQVQPVPTRKNVDFQEIERTKTPNKILSGRVVDNALKRMPVNF